jgi:Proprotein convertase P-domain/Subtilase family/Immunoglobulin domain
MSSFALKRRWALAFGLALLTGPAALGAPAPKNSLGARALEEIRLLQEQKASRTAAQKKLDSQLLYGLEELRHGYAVNGLGAFKAVLARQSDGRVLVDIDAQAAPKLLDFIRQNGGSVLSSFPRYQAIRAQIPLELSEALAQRPEVRSVRPAGRAMTLADVVDAEGDTAHRAAEARAAFGVDGTGVKIGVLSDSDYYLPTAQAAGDLPAVTVLPGQDGSGLGEGTAMLEIVHALAPGASLYFATAFSGEASFAQNIRDLQAAGCRIIVDDVLYFHESPFQDGPIAQAVDDVSAAGALYFSAAGNGGGLDRNTAGTWEGDFNDGGPATLGRGGRLHDFGGATYDTVLAGGTFQRVDLFWSDPLGASTNDYDVYVLDASNDVVRASTNTQDGQSDPYESLATLNVGERIVIVKYSGENRYLYLSSGRGRLEYGTAGSTRGHNASGAPNAFSVAATRVSNPPTAFVGGASDPVEYFSSDGPQRLFYNPDGSAITPGNYSSSGGRVLQKPDITAADGVTTTVPGFAPFLGTSAAAPHAAAIAGLLWSRNPYLTPEAMRFVLTNTSLDIAAPGFDLDSGAGIVMAYPAIAATPPPLLESVQMQDANANGSLDANECAELVITLSNQTSGPLSGLAAVLTTRTPHVLVDATPHTFPDLAPGETAAATTPFRISTDPLFACGINPDFDLHLTATNLGALDFGQPFELHSIVAGIGAGQTFLSTNIPVPIPDLGAIESPVLVQGLELPVARVRVSVFITHTYDEDLRISLRSPDGTEVVLSANNGLFGQDYGTDCNTPTVFSDDAGTPIDLGFAPFVGSFIPDQALSTFNGKAGEALNGAWTLVVADQVAQDVGTLQCWSLEVSPIACFDGGGQCLAGPQITQDVTDQAVTNGGAAQLGVTATGTDPLSYQWFFDGTNALEQATDAMLVLSTVGPANAGTYQVVVSNLYGSVTSSLARLTLVFPPQILSGPADQTVTNGDTAQWSIIADGTAPLSYQWYFDETNALAEGTEATLVLSNVAPVDGGSYEVVVSNAYGSVTSAPVSLAVVVPPNIIVEPMDLVVSNGEPAQLSVVAEGSDPLSYQWYFDGTNALAAGTDALLVLSNATATDAGSYQVVVTNAYGSITSLVAQLSVVLPSLSCSTNRTVPIGMAWDFDPPAVTGAGVMLTVVGTQTNALCGLGYEATRTWQASDSNGFEASCTQTIDVVDTNMPVLVCAGDKVVAYGSGWSFDTPTASESGATQELVYDALTNDLQEQFTAGSVEVGDIITLGGSNRYLSQLTVAYWGSNSEQESFSGPVSAQVRFYLNDGPVDPVSQQATPGTLFYDSGPQGVVATNSGALVLNEFQLTAALGLTDALPESFTWTVKFSGMGSNDAVGLREYGPAVAGQGQGGYWAQSQPGEWQWQAGDLFGAQMQAASAGVTLSVVDTVTNAGCGLGYTAQRTWQGSDSCGHATVCTQTVEVVDQEAPVWVSQPETNQQVLAGDTVTLTVEVSSCSPLSYQWSFDQTNALAEGTDATLVLSNVAPVDAGSYQVVVSNAYGSVTSAPVSLAVVVPPNIIVEPMDLVVSNGEPALLSVVAEGSDPLSYQWYFDGTNALAAGTDALLVVSNATAADTGSYQVVVSNPYGSITSAPALLTIVTPPIITSQPQNVTCIEGSTVFLTVAATGDLPLTYQWQLGCTSPISGVTATSFKLKAVTPADSGTYCVVVSNPFGRAVSQPAVVRVLVKPALISLGQSGGVVSLRFTTVSNLLYSVDYSDELGPPVWSPLPNSSALPGTGQPMTVQDADPASGQRFYRILVR